MNDLFTTVSEVKVQNSKVKSQKEASRFHAKTPRYAKTQRKFPFASLRILASLRESDSPLFDF